MQLLKSLIINLEMKIGLHLYDFIRLKICPLYKIKELIDMRKNILEIGCGKGTFIENF